LIPPCTERRSGVPKIGAHGGWLKVKDRPDFGRCKSVVIQCEYCTLYRWKFAKGLKDDFTFIDTQDSVGRTGRERPAEAG
jgi:hypothetical protein